jgi:membrane protein
MDNKDTQINQEIAAEEKAAQAAVSAGTSGRALGRYRRRHQRDQGLLVPQPPKFNPFRMQVSWKKFARDLYTETQEDHLFTGAAALSYYLLFALFPGLLFMLTLLPYLPIHNLQHTVMNFFQQVMPGDAAKTIQGVVTEITTQKRGGLLSIGLVLALYSASSGLAAVMEQLNITYDVGESRPFWKVRGIALLLTVLFGAMMIGSGVAIVFGGVLQEYLSTHLLVPAAALVIFAIFRWLVVLVLLLGAFASVYYFGPDVEQKFAFITPGSMIGTLVLTAASLAFRYYVQDFSNYAASYGSLGAVIILMLWLYIAGLVVMLGSEVNSLLEHYSADGKKKGEKTEPTAPRSAPLDLAGTPSGQPSTAQ